MVLVFDTNVFLLSEANLWELTDHFPRGNQPPKFLVAVDEPGQIENEYLDYASKADQESAVRVLVEKILDGRELFVFSVIPKWSTILHDRLKDFGCKPIEPELFGVAESTGATLVCPNNFHHPPIPRRFLDRNILHRIQEDKVGPMVGTLREVLIELRSPLEYSPNSLDDLKTLLDRYRLGVKKSSEEREFLEFKCSPEDYLSNSMVQAAVKATCGMLNSRSGWIFIGIDPKTGEIRPFPPRYKDKDAELDTDQLIRTIYQNIDNILPRPGVLVHTWPILDADRQKCVIAIHVRQGGQVYRYKGIKWIRRGPQTIRDHLDDH